MRCSIFPPDDDMLQRWDSVGNEGGIVYPQSTRCTVSNVGYWCKDVGTGGRKKGLASNCNLKKHAQSLFCFTLESNFGCFKIPFYLADS